MSELISHVKGSLDFKGQLATVQDIQDIAEHVLRQFGKCVKDFKESLGM